MKWCSMKIFFHTFFFIAPSKYLSLRNTSFRLKVAGVMVMLSSALQRPHADSKTRDAKVETSVELQQEVANLLTSLSSLPAFAYCLNSGGTPQRLLHCPVSCALPTGQYRNICSSIIVFRAGWSLQYEHKHRMEGLRWRFLEHWSQTNNHSQEF